MRHDVVDSYTGDHWTEPYVSPITGIQEGRQAFYRKSERGSAAYLMSALGQPSAPPPAPQPAWSLTRLACEFFPDQLLLTFPSQEHCQRAADWALRNDTTVEIALHWLTRRKLEPYLKLLEFLKEASRGEQNLRVHRRSFSANSGR